jgi:hypothetical protein
VAQMKLPLKSGKFAALKKLLVYVGSTGGAGRRETWSELAGVSTVIEGAGLNAPIRLAFTTSATQASHVRVRVPPAAVGEAGVWGLLIDERLEGMVTVSKAKSKTVTLVGPACVEDPDSKEPALDTEMKLLCVCLLSSTLPLALPPTELHLTHRRFTSKTQLNKIRREMRRATMVGAHLYVLDRTNVNVRGKAELIAQLDIKCAIYPATSEAAGDVWAFTPGGDDVSNVWYHRQAAVRAADRYSGREKRISARF